MGVAFAAVAEFFGGSAAAAGAADAAVTFGAVDTAAAATITAGAADAAAVGIGAAGVDAASAASLGGGASVAGGSSLGAAGTAAAGGAAAAGGSSLVKTLGTEALRAGVGTAVGSLLAPKPKAPGVPPVLPMPDPLAQQAAQKKSLVEQLARRGRASTLLTDSGSGKLGG